MRYDRVRTGEVAGNVSATQLPSVPANWVKIRAKADNEGLVAVGAAGVTLPAGTTTATAGWALAAGEETPWLPLDNLNRLYYISENAGDDLSYLILGS